MATALVVEHTAARYRSTMEALVELPGVGRKTANVVLGHALGVPGLPVDRHVLRVANRIGIARSDDPDVVEQQLCAALPPADWTRTSDTLILHGRRICKPRPLCDRCAVRRTATTSAMSFRRREIGGKRRSREVLVGRRRPRAKSPLSKRTLRRRRAAKPRGTGRGDGATRPDVAPGGKVPQYAERRSREVQVAARERGDAVKNDSTGLQRLVEEALREIPRRFRAR